MANPTPALIADTNFLMEFPAVHQQRWRLKPVEILISEDVIKELRGLTYNSDRKTASRASAAMNEIARYRNPLVNLTWANTGVTVTIVPACDDPSFPPLDPQTVDHQLIILALQLSSGENPRFCALLSNDRLLCDIAESAGVLAVSYTDEERFHQELANKHQWSTSLRAAALGKIEKAAPEAPKKPARPRQAPDKKVRLERTIKRIYRRIKAVGCRATLYLAPLEGRIALALEAARQMRHPERQVVIVAVKTVGEAQHWAGDLRQKGGFSTQEVQIFGIDALDRIDKARVVIYRHDQIARRLPLHVSRLDRAQKRITAVVDGCDTLDPVELAILLYECDHFIGLNHYPIAYKRARGSRMLSVVLHNRSLIDYSFGDAERDGWGYACDLYIHKIDFTPEELQLWQETQANHQRLRERFQRDYPELAENDNLWANVSRILDQTASPALVDLIRQREEFEQMAQLARQKCTYILETLSAPPHHPYRRIIFDYAGQWTPVLLAELAKAGVQAAKLPEGEGQRQVWERFSGSKIDTLLVSNVPPLDLPAACFHQLIILTPLRPLDEVLAMIDWAISHTHIPEALRLEVLYVDGTSEKVAALDLAGAGFGLRYT
jgi:hypothetical protein